MSVDSLVGRPPVQRRAMGRPLFDTTGRAIGTPVMTDLADVLAQARGLVGQLVQLLIHFLWRSAPLGGEMASGASWVTNWPPGCCSSRRGERRWRAGR